MMEHFNTVQILGSDLDPEQMIDARAVRASRLTRAESRSPRRP